MLLTKRPFEAYKTEFVFTLNDKILEHIEHLRQQHKNKDMILYLIFKLAYLKHSITFGSYPIKHAENNNDMARISDDNRLERDIKRTNSVQKILVKENKKNDADGLIFYIVDQFRRQIIIPSDDWTDNFLSQLGK